MHYYLVELNYFSGGTGLFPFLREENAKRCLAHYAAQADENARAVGGNAKNTGNSVYFEWDGPLGIVRWSVKLTQLATEDHLWKAKK